MYILIQFINEFVQFINELIQFIYELIQSLVLFQFINFQTKNRMFYFSSVFLDADSKSEFHFLGRP